MASGDSSLGEPSNPPSPRAFAIGTGVFYQTVGGLLVFASCIVWAITAWLVPKSAQPVAQWTDFFRGAHLPSALLTVALLNSFLGGIALLAVGLGLQGERKSSGRAAMAASGLMTVCYIVVAVTYAVALGSLLPALVAFALAVATALLFMLAGHSTSILKRHPPPADLNVATPELLEEFRQKRLERLKHYEP